MFTGLVQAMGRIQRRGNGLLVEGCGPFGPLSLGDSVAVDGVCLTVAECVSEGFRADVSEETLQRTTLGQKAELRWCRQSWSLPCGSVIVSAAISSVVTSMPLVR